MRKAGCFSVYTADQRGCCLRTRLPGVRGDNRILAQQRPESGTHRDRFNCYQSIKVLINILYIRKSHVSWRVSLAKGLYIFLFMFDLGSTHTSKGREAVR